MKKRLVFSLCLAVVLLLCACGQEPVASVTQPTAGSGSASNISGGDAFSDRDYEVGYDTDSSVVITLSGDSASASGSGVEISGSDVTITASGTYVFRGTLNNGTITVDIPKDEKAQLVLDGVSIHSEGSAPLCILQSDKVFLTLAADSVNTLSNGGSFTKIDGSNVDGVIFSKEDLTLNGSGSLTVTSPGGNGIVSKDELTVTGGSYTVTAADHGLEGKDNVRIVNADFSITSGKDGIRAENEDDTALGYVYIESGTFAITSEGDGISASAYLQIQNGGFSITSGGGSVNGSNPSGNSWGGGMGFPGSMGGFGGTPDTEEGTVSAKGIKATGQVLISGGTFVIDSADDALHSNADLTVQGGSFEIAAGDDAFHADETLTVSDGKIRISESYEGLEGLHILVSGGEINLTATNDGLNAAGGTDQSGFGGMGGDRFGGRGGPGGMGGSSDGTIEISGGTLYINASGDGIDANGSLTISGGFTTVCGPTWGDTATLDYNTTGVITGGTFIGTGASGMAQSFSDSRQGVIALSVGNPSAGTRITLTDSSGKELISYAPELSFAVVILSTPEMVKGESYTITIGSQSGTFTAS